MNFLAGTVSCSNKRVWSMSWALGIFILVIETMIVGCTPRSTDDINKALAELPTTLGEFYIDKEQMSLKPANGIILVSEPHWNARSQYALYEFLQKLVGAPQGTNLSLFCVEGSSGRFDLSSVRDLSNGQTNRLVYGVSKGLLSGWEMYAIEHSEIRVEGVEDPQVYREQVSTITDSYKTFEEDVVQPAYEQQVMTLVAYLQAIKETITNAPPSELPELQALRFLLENIMHELAEHQDASDVVRRYADVHVPLSTAGKKLMAVALHHATNCLNIAEGESGKFYYDSLREVWKTNATILGRIDEDARLFQVASKRDGVMVDGCLKAMKQSGATLCVMFIGSAHRDGVVSGLAAHNVSCVYYEQAQVGRPNFELYMKRLQNAHPLDSMNHECTSESLATIPPSFLNPIVYPEIKSEFLSYFEKIDPTQARVVSEVFLSPINSTVDRAEILSKVAKHLEAGNALEDLKTDAVEFDDFLPGGASGDEVAKLWVKTTSGYVPVVVKIFSDTQKAEQDIVNVQAINEAAKAKGLGALYAAYYGGKEMSVKGKTYYLTLQEMVGGPTLKTLIGKKSANLAPERKQQYVDRYAERIRELDGITEDLRKSGKIRYPDATLPYRVLNAKLQEKLQFSIELNHRLYREPANTEALNGAYSKLREMLNHFFDRDGSPPTTDVCRDDHPGNYFPANGGLFIDSADDVIASNMKTLALRIKDQAAAELDLDHLDLNDSANAYRLTQIFNLCLPANLTEDGFAEVIGHLYLMDFSDSKIAAAEFKERAESEKSFVDQLDRTGISDKERVAGFHAVSTAGRERQVKNFIIINLLKTYDTKYHKNLGPQIDAFEQNFANGLYVLLEVIDRSPYSPQV